MDEMIKQIGIFFACAAIIVLGCYGVRSWNQYLRGKYGTIIVLNGPAASGKTSLQKAFQKLMKPAVWIKFGMDTIFEADMVSAHTAPTLRTEPPEPGEQLAYWYLLTHDSSGKPIIRFQGGELADRFMCGMHNAIAGFAAAGCNVIVDYVARKREPLINLRDTLKPYRTFWVGVNASIEVLEQREMLRNSEWRGFSRGYFQGVHSHPIQYDLFLDTGKETLEQCAFRLRDLVMSKL